MRSLVSSRPTAKVIILAAFTLWMVSLAQIAWANVAWGERHGGTCPSEPINVRYCNEVTREDCPEQYGYWSWGEVCVY